MRVLLLFTLFAPHVSIHPVQQDGSAVLAAGHSPPEVSEWQAAPALAAPASDPPPSDVALASARAPLPTAVNGSRATIAFLQPRFHFSSDFEQIGSADNWFVGVLLEVLGQLINVLGKHMWRSIGLRRQEVSDAEFWLYSLGGTLAVLVYVVSDVFALRFTSQSIISACDGMAIVWNNLLAPFTLKERFTTAHLVACLFIIGGTVGAAFSGSHAQGQSLQYYLQLLQQGPAIGYYVFVSLALIGLCLIFSYCKAAANQAAANAKGASSKEVKSKRLSGFAYGALAGTIAGNVFLTKVASTILAVEPDPFGNGYLYLFATLTIIMHATALGMLYWVRGLRRTHTFFCSCGRSCRRHAIVQSPALYRGYVTMRRYCS